MNLCMYDVYANGYVKISVHPHIHTDIYHMQFEKALQATLAWTTLRSIEAKRISTPGSGSVCVQVSLLPQSVHMVLLSGTANCWFLMMNYMFQITVNHLPYKAVFLH